MFDPIPFSTMNDQALQNPNPVDTHIEPGETVIWKDRPSGAGTSEGAKSRLDERGKPVAAICLIVIAGIVWLISSGWQEVPLLNLGPEELRLGLILLAGTGVVMLGTFLAKHREEAWQESMGFAITDQRILVVFGRRITSLFPAELGQLRIENRRNGVGDVVLLRGQKVDASQKDRQAIAFVQVNNPDAVLERVETWAREKVSEAEQQAAKFVSGDPSTIRTIENPALGLSLKAPEDWAVEGRQKKSPFGTDLALDFSTFKPIQELDEWNTLRISGPLGASIALELFETASPLKDFETLTGKLWNAARGEPIETEGSTKVGDFVGFTITRRDKAAYHPARTNEVVDIARLPVLCSDVVLHDGHRQLYAEMKCPDNCPETRKALRAMLASVEVR